MNTTVYKLIRELSKLPADTQVDADITVDTDCGALEGLYSVAVVHGSVLCYECAEYEEGVL